MFHFLGDCSHILNLKLRLPKTENLGPKLNQFLLCFDSFIVPQSLGRFVCVLFVCFVLFCFSPF